MSGGTLETLTMELARAFQPLEDRLQSGQVTTLFAEMGLNVPGLASQTAFTDALGQPISAVQKLPPLIKALEVAIESKNTDDIVSALAGLLQALATIIQALDTIANRLSTLSVSGVSSQDLAAFASDLTVKLIDYVIVSYLEEFHPAILAWLALLGIADVSPQNAASIDLVHPPYTRKRIRYQSIQQLLTAPHDLVRDTYGWGLSTFDALNMFQRLQAALWSAAVPAAIETSFTPRVPPELHIFWLALKPREELSPPGLELDLVVPFGDGYVFTFPITPQWSFQLSIRGALPAGLSAILTPPASLALTSPSGPLSGRVDFGAVGSGVSPSQPLQLFGLGGASGVFAQQVDATIAGGFDWSASGQAIGELSFELTVQHGQVVIDTSNIDGFLAKLLPSDGLDIDFAFKIGWSSKRGVYFTGGAGIETAIAIDLSIGPIDVKTLHVGIFTDSSGLQLQTTADIAGAVGPVSAAVERIGVQAILKFQHGNLGPVNFAVKFKPPNGLGVSIDAGPITGGGFIEFDPDNGRYAGVLQLSLYSIQVKAIGLLDTKMPGGESGYSFLVIISVEFTPIQLGFGITLNGVGGLCGINRNFVTAALQAGLRQHSLDHILFPKDPVKNAPAIISDLRAIFPPAEGRYVFGPMLELGWGGGLNLVTVELGVILALPSPVVIAILGQLNVNLPNPDAAIVELHLDVLGIIDFGKKLFSLDATLHDSRIVVFTIYGDMAMRLSWGNDPSFALSIGGLNPHFQPPAGFPTLKRLTIALSATESFRLTIQTYFAITSNSFQLGAHAELYIGAGDFNVYGWLGFDALLIFEPFSFVVDFTAGLALRSGSSTLMGISISGELSGPTPWHAKGEAHVSLLFFDIGVHVDTTWGESRQIDAPHTDAWPQLHDAIANLGNWSGALPQGTPAVVTLAKPAADTKSNVLADPSGALTMRERVCPLDLTLTKFGEAVPGPQNIFSLDAVSLGGQPVAFTKIRDKFAPAQFEQMSDQDKLSRPSFEDRTAGFSVGDGLVAVGHGFGLDLAFEDVYVDDKAPPPPSNPVHYRPSLNLQAHWALSNAAAKSPLRGVAMGSYAPPVTAAPLVTMSDEYFVVATTTDLAQRADITQPTTKGEAYQALAAHLSSNPAEREQLQVLPLHELAQ
jgi:hypothetical protein